jgi:lysylphosphatidylglycerol synthetase-like protein (DUF2156 family)
MACKENDVIAVSRPRHETSTRFLTAQERLRALRAHGNFALAYSATFQQGLGYFGTAEGFLAYKQVGSTCFVLANPLAPIAGCADLIRSFVNEKRDVCFWQTSRQTWREYHTDRGVCYAADLFGSSLAYSFLTTP